MLSPEMVTALLPYGIGVLALVIGYLVFAQIMKTWRVRMIAKSGKVEKLD